MPGYTTGHVDQNAMGGSFTGTMGGMSQGGMTGGMAGAKTWGPQPGYNNTMAPTGNLKVGPPCLPAWQCPSPSARDWPSHCDISLAVRLRVCQGATGKLEGEAISRACVARSTRRLLGPFPHSPLQALTASPSGTSCRPPTASLKTRRKPCQKGWFALPGSALNPQHLCNLCCRPEVLTEAQTAFVAPEPLRGVLATCPSLLVP